VRIHRAPSPDTAASTLLENERDGEASERERERKGRTEGKTEVSRGGGGGMKAETGERSGMTKGGRGMPASRAAD